MFRQNNRATAHVPMAQTLKCAHTAFGGYALAIYLWYATVAFTRKNYNLEWISGNATTAGIGSRGSGTD